MVPGLDSRWQLHAQIRKNITETLVSLRVNTVDDIQQITAVLAQCMVGRDPGMRSSPAVERGDMKRPSCALGLQPVVTPDLSLQPREAAPHVTQDPGVLGTASMRLGTLSPGWQGIATEASAEEKGAKSLLGGGCLVCHVASVAVCVPGVSQ